MGISQITILVIYAITLLIDANKHGKYRKEKHNFWFTLLDVCFMIYLLYSGGFFNQ